MPIFLDNFRPFLREKNCTQVPVGLNHPCFLTLTSATTNTVIGKSWDAFTKRVLVEKHIIGTMFENPPAR